MDLMLDLLVDMLLGVTTSVQVANLPPPMTPAEVRAQVLYTDDCKTTRRGIEMTCQQGFTHDLDNSK